MKINGWCNSTWTNAKLYRSQQELHYSPSLPSTDKVLNNGNSAKYLGLNINKTLSLDIHINEVTQKAHNTLSFSSRNISRLLPNIKDRCYGDDGRRWKSDVTTPAWSWCIGLYMTWLMYYLLHAYKSRNYMYTVLRTTPISSMCHSPEHQCTGSHTSCKPSDCRTICSDPW